MKSAWIILVGVNLFLTGCASFDSEMTASRDINPDINGNPSPIAVTVFELSDPIRFEGASFIHLYTQPQSVLGTTLLAQKSLMLAPGETRTLHLPIIKNAAYLGYIAAYRNLNNVTWQTIVPVNPSGWFGESFDVTINTKGIQIQD